ncbi:hypothetical protein Hanom_Chr17g01524481 [Helianthus anomalus]
MKQTFKHGANFLSYSSSNSGNLFKRCCSQRMETNMVNDAKARMTSGMQVKINDFISCFRH